MNQVFSKGNIQIIAVTISTGLAAITLGLIASSGAFVISMLAAGMLVGLLTLLLPAHYFLGLILISTFAIQGNLFYFLRLNQAQWIPYLLCLIAIFKINFPISKTSNAEKQPRTPLSNLPIIFLALYFICMIFSISMNLSRMEQVIVGLKNAIPIWMVAFLIIQTNQIDKISPLVWRIIYGIFYLQVPLVLYQHFVIVPSRPDRTTAMDAVVGTFGGLIEGGGASSTLVAFAIFVLIFESAKFTRGLSSRWHFGLVASTAAVIILSGEVKAAFIWLPMCVFYVLRKRIFKNPFVFLTSVSATLIFLFGLFAAYDAMYWQQRDQKSAGDRIERMQYFFDTKNIDYRTGEVSRGASFALWFNDSNTGLAHRLFGYGAGASRISATGGLGDVAKRFAPLSVAATTVAALLWDAGVVGLFCFASVVLTSLIYAMRLSNEKRLSELDRAQMEAWGALLLIMCTVLIYNRTLIDEPSTQMLLALAVGFVVQARINLQVKPSTANNRSKQPHWIYAR